MNRSDKLRFVTFLTVVRFPLVLLFFVGAIAYSHPSGRSPWLFGVTFFVLILSAVTDLFDGYFARRFRVTTPFGAHVDPLMDKFFYLACLPLLVFITAAKNDDEAHAVLLLVLTLLFLARDQWVTFLRAIGSMYDVGGGAHWTGKLRTAYNFPLICLIYFAEEAPPAIQFVPRPLLYALEGIAVLITVISLYAYTRRYWPYLRRAADIQTSEE